MPRTRPRTPKQLGLVPVIRIVRRRRKDGSLTAPYRTVSYMKPENARRRRRRT